MADDFSQRYGNLLTGGYDCVDRIVLNAYYPLGPTTPWGTIPVGSAPGGDAGTRAATMSWTTIT
jgi:hypothetical protein